MNLEWKQNWPETRRHMEDWWRHKGLVVGMWGAPQADPPRETGFACEPALSFEHGYTGPAARARRNHALLAGLVFPGDILAMADTDMGPGSLALYLGSDPLFADSTVWFQACLDDISQPIRFDPANRWWQVTLETHAPDGRMEPRKVPGGLP